MPREIGLPLSLQDVVLPDARTGQSVDLGLLPENYLLTAIRHRF